MKIMKIDDATENKFGFYVGRRYAVTVIERDADQIVCCTKTTEYDYYEEAREAVERELEDVFDDYVKMSADCGDVESDMPAAYEMDGDRWFVVGCTGFNTVFHIVEVPEFFS